MDGIALAIELAAARMVSMSAQDVRDRLGDRFRLLSGSRRGLERHQTLRHAVQWSYDLLDDDERTVLRPLFGVRRRVRSGRRHGHLCADRLDEYAVLDRLDSLVRKSLVTAERVDGHARYGMLETIRQFAEEQLAATGTIDDVRDRHARYFADQAIAHWDIWDGPGQRVAIDWVDVEFANLRAGFRWAADQADLDTAAAIAAHTAMLGYVAAAVRTGRVGRGDPRRGHRRRLPSTPPPLHRRRLCCVHRAPDAAVGYAHTAVALEADPRYDPFEPGMERHVGGRRPSTTPVGSTAALEVCAGLAAQPGLAHVVGLVRRRSTCCRAVGRADGGQGDRRGDRGRRPRPRQPLLDRLARSIGYGRAFADADPARALDAFRQALAFAREHRLPYWEAIIAREAAGLEAVHGDLEQALALFDTAIDSFHRAGNVANLAVALAYLAVFFDRFERPEIAATIYGASTRHGDQRHGSWTFPHVVDHLRAVLGETVVRPAASPPGRPWNPPTPSPTPATRSKPLAAKSPTPPRGPERGDSAPPSARRVGGGGALVAACEPATHGTLAVDNESRRACPLRRP